MATDAATQEATERADPSPSLQTRPGDAVAHACAGGNAMQLWGVGHALCVQEKFLHDRIKIAGKTGVLGDAITITREASQLTVTSKVHISKRYLKVHTHAGRHRAGCKCEAARPRLPRARTRRGHDERRVRSGCDSAAHGMRNGRS
jgi:hypothetical protein